MGGGGAAEAAVNTGCTDSPLRGLMTVLPPVRPQADRCKIAARAEQVSREAARPGSPLPRHLHRLPGPPAQKPAQGQGVRV